MAKDPTLTVFAKQGDYNFTAWACGPTSLYTALKILGHREITFDRVVSHAGSSRGWQEVLNILEYLLPDQNLCAGFDQGELSRAAKAIGYRVDEIGEDTGSEAYATLLRETEGGWPVLLAVDSDTHWVLAFGVEAKGAWVMDPNDDSEAFVWYSRQELLGRWRDAEWPYYTGFTVSPESNAAQRRCEDGLIIPSPELLGWMDTGDEADEAMVVALRSDLASVFQGIPQSSGEPAGDVFRRFSDSLAESCAGWTADVSLRWAKDRVALIQEMLEGLTYRVPSDYDAFFASQLGFIITFDALAEAGVDPDQYEPGQLLTYEDDAERVLDRSAQGESATDFLLRTEEAISFAAATWVEDWEVDTALEHLRGLAGIAVGTNWKVSARDELTTVADLSVLLANYAWHLE